MAKDTSTLTVPNDTAYLPVISACVTASAAQVGFSEEEASRIRLAVDEACTNVIETAFEPGEKATFTVTCQKSEAGLWVIIADKGMPFNPAAVADYDPQAGLDRELGGLGFYLMKQVMDEVRFVSKGRDGKELHLVKYLEAGNIATLLSAEELQPYEARVEPAPPGSYVFRLMQPAEAIEVAKCVYRTYGYTYPGEHVYYPERLSEMNRTGEQISIVAISDKGEVAGYCAIFGGQPDDPIRELGQAAVDPAHRGRQIISQLTHRAIDEARARGMAGLFGEPVTNHPFSQQVGLKLGFRDTAILLGYIPQSVYFKKIGAEALPQRETLLYCLLPLRPWPAAQVYVPPQHRPLLERIYANLGIERELVPLQTSAVSQTLEVLSQPRPEQSVLSTRVLTAINVARLEITTYGQYVTTEVEIKLRELCRKGIACVHLDLPLSDPWTALLCADFAAQGFLLAGVLPKAGGQDVLRLQYLNAVPIDLDKIHVVSEVGRELLAYVKRKT